MIDPENLLRQNQQKYETLRAYREGRHSPSAVGQGVPRRLRGIKANAGVAKTMVDAIMERVHLLGFAASDKRAEAALNEMVQWEALSRKLALAASDLFTYGRVWLALSADKSPAYLGGGTQYHVDVCTPLNAVEYQGVVYVRLGKGHWRVYTEDSVQDELDGQTVYRMETQFPLIVRCDWGQTSGVAASGITRDIQAIDEGVARLMGNLQAAGETLANPVHVLKGVTPHESVDLEMGDFLRLKNPQAGTETLQAASLQNQSEGIKALLLMAVGSTKLPSTFLLASTTNPASAEAIRASEARLIALVESVESVLESALLRLMLMLLYLRGLSSDEVRRSLSVRWRDPGTPTQAALTDAVIKQLQAGVITVEQAQEKLGMTPEEVQRWVASLGGDWFELRDPAEGDSDAAV